MAKFFSYSSLADCDADQGAYLVRPTRVVSVRPLGADEIAEILADAPALY